MKRTLALAIVALAFFLFGQQHNTANIDNLSAYAQLYEDTPAGTVITLTTAGTFYPWVSSTVGAFRNMTPSAGTDNITVLYPGTYKVAFSVSWLAAASARYHFSLFKSGAESDVAELEEDAGAGTPLTHSSATMGMVTCVAGDILDLRVSADTNTKTATIYHASLNVFRVN